jgi:hypothetical protein
MAPKKMRLNHGLPLLVVLVSAESKKVITADKPSEPMPAELFSLAPNRKGLTAKFAKSARLNRLFH